MDTRKSISVEEVMSTPLMTISADATVKAAAKSMREADINALFVTAGVPSIVTSTDVLDLVAKGTDPEAVSVSTVMTTPVESVPPNVHLEEAAAMMTSLGIKHLPVTDDGPLENDYIGMVSSADVTAQLA